MTAPGQDWIDHARRLVTGLAAEHPAAGDLAGALGGLLGGAPTGTADRGHATADADCRWCPLCTGLAAVRGRRPDLVDAVADLLVTAGEALRAQAGTGARGTPRGDAADPATTHDDGAREPGAPPATEEPVPHPQSRTARVQRIDVA
ncbi:MULTISPECIES: hypothetical protein [unclassified Modestobacter]